MTLQFPWHRTEAGPNGCLIWQGARSNDGYGLVNIQRRLFRAHRLAWTVARGSIPAGSQVLHSCDKNYAKGDPSYRLCVNPDHLWIGTNDQNMSDMVSKGRQAAGERHGFAIHPELRARGEQHGRARLDWDRVAAIRELHSSGLSYTRLARDFGVGRTTIGHILAGRTWVNA